MLAKTFEFVETEEEARSCVKQFKKIKTLTERHTTNPLIHLGVVAMVKNICLWYGMLDKEKKYENE